MLVDNLCDTRHAVVTDLECIAVEDLMQLGGLRKMLVYKRAESSADICGNVAAVGWIVPGYFPPASPFTVFPRGWRVRNPFTVPALFSASSYTGLASANVSMSLEMSLRRRLMEAGRFFRIFGG